MKITEDIINKLDIVQEEFNLKTLNILYEYAKSKNPYKKGDIIKDHHQIGRIISPIIYVSNTSRKIEISYKCERLTKQLKPYKGGEETRIYLCNIKELLTPKNS